MKSPGSCYELCGYWEPDSLWKLLGAYPLQIGPTTFIPSVFKVSKEGR
jgi:hypothetical protein